MLADLRCSRSTQTQHHRLRELMSRHGSQKRQAPRKSAIAKAALRKTVANPKPENFLPNPRLEDFVQKRQRVNFTDPLMRSAAMGAQGISLCAFLVSLAAFQRGLNVTFYYERASIDPRYAKALPQGHRGEIFSISNGARTHVFSRTMGDKIDQAANVIAEDKHLTKAALKRAGIKTPEGIVVDKSQTALIDGFLRQNRGKQFVVKPFNGTLGSDVHTNLEAAQVPFIINSMGSSRILLEEHVSGIEYRVYVVDGRYIASYITIPANVVGDGHNSIQHLIEQKNTVRLNNPSLVNYPIKDSGTISDFIGNNGFNLNSVPLAGERIFLSDAFSSSRGGDPVDATHTAPEALKIVAVNACRAIGLTVCGLDAIVRETNEGPEVYVLELNQRPHIGAQSFPIDGPGQGNSIAEAIVDYYFPETISNRMLPSLAYDFGFIKSAMESMQVSSISLPSIKEEWKMIRLRLSGSSADAGAKAIANAAQASGVFMIKFPDQKGEIQLHLSYAPENFKIFLNVLPASLRGYVEKNHLTQCN
jgi:D-alanine-D-alanine ligase-like ATP-grasp enzyme